MRHWRALGALVVAISVFAGCAPSGPAPSQAPRPPRILEPAFAGSPELPPPDLTDDGPGSLIEVEPVEDDPYFAQASATAVRVVYRSTAGINGPPTTVSGVVAVPPGAPPRGGWPILALGHDLVGLANKCAPSLAPELAGYSALASVMMTRGYVVAMTDYQGLGPVGPPHSPTDAASLGNNMIDIARAARRVLPTTSTRWAALGTGEGGSAAWAASERAAGYGGGLDLVGAAALSPLADLSGLATVAENGALTPQQYKLQMFIVEDLASGVGLNRDDFRSGLARERWDLLTDCAPEDPALATQTLSELRAADLVPSSPAAAAALREALISAALPLNGPPPVVPLLVIYATEDPLLPPAWVNSAVSRSCAKGDPIELVGKIGDVTTTNDVNIQYALDWLQARFDGVPPASVCQGSA